MGIGITDRDLRNGCLAAVIILVGLGAFAGFGAAWVFGHLEVHPSQCVEWKP